MFLVTFDLEMPILRSGVMQKVFINKCKSSESSNQRFFNVMVSFSKIKGKLVMTYCKVKLFSGDLSYGASNEPHAFLEPSQTNTEEHFGKNI